MRDAGAAQLVYDLSTRFEFVLSMSCFKREHVKAVAGAWVEAAEGVVDGEVDRVVLDVKNVASLFVAFVAACFIFGERLLQV